MIRFLKIASIVTMLCFVWGLASPVSGNSGERDKASAPMVDSGGGSSTNNLGANDSGIMEEPGVKKAAKKFPWLLAGLGTAVVITAILLLTGKKKSSPDGNNIEYGTVADIDGNVYRTVRIGTQWWMAENLKTTRYNDGVQIPLVTDEVSWANLYDLKTPGFCFYNNDATLGSVYGGLYNWYAVNTGKLAPEGWHVPTDAEYNALANYLGGESIAGGKMKEVGFAHWIQPNEGATNSSGFTALPGGCRASTFISLTYVANFWTSTEANASEAWRRHLTSAEGNARRDRMLKHAGFSVRCIKD
jgi:uncharacterized protein (TIGR02145 family)